MGAVQRRFGLAAGAAGLVAALTLGVHAQDGFQIHMVVLDKEGVPVLDIPPSDVRIEEEAGPGTVLSVSRVGWPLKLTVLVDNGPGTADALVHLRNGLNSLLDGIPRQIPVSLIATAPNPRWLIRESTDPIQLKRAVGRLVPDEGLGRFSDALGEYAARLDREFQQVEEGLPPYLPVLVSVATINADGSEVLRERNEKMLLSLRKHRVWTNMIMVTPSRGLNVEGDVSNIGANEGQNAEIAHLVQQVTGGSYVPITGSGTSALASNILPSLAQVIAFRYLKQMTQHRVLFDRAPGAAGPMKNFSLTLVNHPGARVIASVDANFP